MMNLIKAIFLIFLVTVSCVTADDEQRELSLVVNPGCELAQCPEGDFDIAYVRANSENDSIHYIFSNKNIPTLIAVQTLPNVTLKIDWTKVNTKNITSSLSFSGSFQNAIAMYLPNLFEIVDKKDDAKFKLENVTLIDWSNFKWENISCSNETDKVTVTFKSSNLTSNETVLPGGSISLKLQIFNKGGRVNLPPNLINTPNSSQIFFVLDGLRASEPESRFGFKVAMEYPMEHSLKYNEDNEMDDEQSPGVFKVVSLKDANSTDSGYIFWKPVSYMNDKHIVTKSTDALFVNSNSTAGELSDALTPFLNQSSITTFYIMFGMIDDGFYVSNNYTSWTAVVGFGTVPQETTSVLAQLLFAIGMGIPLIIMIIAALFAIKKRVFAPRDDSLLIP